MEVCAGDKGQRGAGGKGGAGGGLGSGGRESSRRPQPRVTGQRIFRVKRQRHGDGCIACR